MILMQVQVEETFQIGIIEVPEKDVGVEWQSFRESRLLNVELALLGSWSEE